MAAAKKSGSKSKSTGKKTTASKKKNDVSTDLLKELYREMLLIRRFEEKSGQLYGMGLIGGFCHLYIGQEAVVVGVQSVLEDRDSVITAYRDHGHMLATGMDPKGVMAELTGRETGYSRGKGGSMHMFSKEKNFYGGHGIVGATAPLGAGLAFAHKYKGDGGITTCYFGEGAANQGQVHESYNMAALWDLPVIFIIENNRYGMGTSQERAAAGEALYKRGEGFGIPGEQVDGMDVVKVREAAEKAVKHVRDGKGPYILEYMTYRYRGHSMSDPAKYRSKDEVKEVREHNDPIELIKARLADAGVKEDDLKATDKDIRKIINEAAEFAQQSPEPAAEELWTDILIEDDAA